jgi:hypothetical protein
VRSPQVDTLQVSLHAFAEAAAFELEVAVRALPELLHSTGVCDELLCICQHACEVPVSLHLNSVESDSLSLLDASNLGTQLAALSRQFVCYNMNSGVM